MSRIPTRRRCTKCGRGVRAESVRCDWCGTLMSALDPYDTETTIIRVYRGRQQADAVAAFQADAAELAQYGYTPTSQSWAQGQWGCGAWLVALALCILLIGLLVFIYMLIVKPEGTLTVTYTKVA